MKHTQKRNQRKLQSHNKKYLPLYLAEYGYNYNKRNEKNDFEAVINNAVTDEKCITHYKPKKDVEKIVYGKQKCKKDGSCATPKKKSAMPKIVKKKVVNSGRKNEQTMNIYEIINPFLS